MPDLKGVFNVVKDELLNIAGAALKSGATNVGKQLASVKRDENPSSEINLGTIANALKSGILATGQDLMVMGMNRVNEISSQDENSKVSQEKVSQEST